MQQVVECVPNFSNGRHPEVYNSIAEAIGGVRGAHVLDVSADADHNRTVITFVGEPAAVEEAAFRAIETAAQHINLDKHEGEHPRIGATDVCPFIPVQGVTTADCVAMAQRLGQRVGDELGIAVYLYGAAAISRSGADLTDGSVLTGFSDITATSRSLVLMNDRFAHTGHTFGFSLSQPLAVTAGYGTAALATGWADGTPATETRRIDLAPAARETALEIFHQFSGPGDSTLGSHFIYRRNPDNIAQAPNEKAAFVRFSMPL
jgi:hypothetical protein